MKKLIPIGIIIGIIILGAILYVTLPILSFNFLQLPIILICIATVIFVATLATVKSKADFGFKQKLTGGILGILVLYFIVSIVASSAIFTWKTKQTQLNLVEVASFDESVPNVDMVNLIILDEEDARRTSEKLITEKDPSLGSLYQIGEGTLSVVKDKPYWIFPLEYRGFFKWL